MSARKIACDVFVAVLLSMSLSAPAQSSPLWVGTWAASPCAPKPDDARSTALSLKGKTLREIVHVSVGGTSLRLRLTNAFGKVPLHINSLSVALREGDDRVVPSTMHVVTFGGRGDVRIPAGAYALSDPLPFPLAANVDLSISLYTEEEVGAPTTHFLAQTTSYVADGDQTSDPKLTTPTAIKVWLLLAGVEVTSASAKGTIVALGSSITDGYASTPNANHRWTDFLELRLAETHHQAFGILNEGISGNRLLHDGAGPLAAVFGQSAAARFDRDVLSQAGVRYVILFAGGNDISQPGSPSAPLSEEVSAEEIIAGYAQLIQRAREHNIRVIGGTLTPFEGMTTNVYNAEREAKRVAVNRWMRTTPLLEGLIDFDRAILDPDHPTRLLPRYDSGDHLHPNDEGYRRMAEEVKLSMFR